MTQTTPRNLLTDEQLTVWLVRPDGEILYESPPARELLDRDHSEVTHLPGFLSVPTAWEDIVGRISRGEPVKDAPVLLETIRGQADLGYLTVLPQRTGTGRLDALLCAWAARESVPAATARNGNLTDYARELEGLLEHRTYQQLLAAERNEFAQEALDVLSVGVLVLSRDGEVIYRNTAMCDDFGLRPAEYLQPNLKHFASAAVVKSFGEVVASGIRVHHLTTDPSGKSAFVDLLPLLRAEAVQRVVAVFTRPQRGEGDPA